jgi:hypothetical protein
VIEDKVEELLNSNNNKEKISQAQWFMPLILVSWKEEIGKILVWNQLRQKVSETTLNQKKAGCGGMHLSFLLCRKYEQENLDPC